MRFELCGMGCVKSTDFGQRVGGFNVLNVPDELIGTPKHFRSAYNGPWLENAMGRNDIFLMATEPSFGPTSALFWLNMQSGKVELSAFGQEYLLMRQNSFAYDSGLKQMVRKP